MTRSLATTLGPAPIVDFDGTMAYLPVDWVTLRRRLRVGSLNELWDNDDHADWAAVTAAELTAIDRARPIPATLEALAAASGFVVVTDNHESVVSAFLSQHRQLASKVLAVFGRGYHGGPKRNQEVFERAFRAASSLVGDLSDQVVYCGDQDYELQFATTLGARAVRVLLSGELDLQPSLAQASKGNR